MNIDVLLPILARVLINQGLILECNKNLIARQHRKVLDEAIEQTDELMAKVIKEYLTD